MNSDRVTNIEANNVAGVTSPRTVEKRGEVIPPTSSIQPERSGSQSWVVGLLQASDSFYPTGSYAHSFGLEGLVHEGVVRDQDTLREFIFRSALPSLRHVELPLAAQAWAAFAKPDWKRVAELCVLSSALKSAREARLASENIGRQRVELLARLHGHATPLAQQFLERVIAGKWPHSSAVAAALEGRVLGAPLDAVLSGVCYANLAALMAAAMKLLRLGQNAAQSLLTEALATTPRLNSAAQATPFEEIGWFNPWLDIVASRHESADARMFIS